MANKNANNPKNDTSDDMGVDNKANKKVGTYYEGGRPKKRGPRRGGRGSNAATNIDHQQNNKTLPAAGDLSSTTKDIDEDAIYDAQFDDNASATNATTPVTDTSLDNDYEDEAALSEGGVKAVGDKRVIPFMSLEKPMAIFSIIIVLVSLVSLFVNGLNLGLDFTGGVSADVSYEQPVEQSEVTNSLAQAGFDDAVVQYLGSNTELLVRLPPQSDNIDGLNESLDKALDLSSNDAQISSVNIIGSQVGGEVYFSSVIAIVTALIMMMLYVGVRFQFKLAVGALAALFHDAIVTLGVFSLFQFPFDLTVLAAILALIGYSLNDTIVVYDRIRENFRRVRGVAPSRIIDLSLTETLRRTIMTISTVLVVVLAMLFLGGAGLFWFSVAFFIGLIAGTYSSTYISSTIPLAMGLSREDFVIKVKPEFEEEVVSFNDPKAFND